MNVEGGKTRKQAGGPRLFSGLRSWLRVCADDIWSTLKLGWRNIRRRQALAKETDPRVFRELSRELCDLAGMAQRLWPHEDEFAAKIRRIREEMEQLNELAAKPEFRRLSMEKRIQLKRDLMQSREQLLETVQSAPTPTQLKQ